MLSTHIWLQLSPQTRQRIATFLQLPKSGTTQIEYNGTIGRVISDGFTSSDLSNITTELLKKELGESTLLQLGVKTDNFYDMFNELVRRVELPIQEFPQPKPMEHNVDIKIEEPYKEPEHTVLANVEKPAIKTKIDKRTKAYKKLIKK